MFCPECGADHHAAERAEVEAVKETVDRDIEIERLRTKRDIEVARITAGAAERISEAEAEQEVAHAEGVVEGVEAVLSPAVTEEPEDPEPEVIDVSDVAVEPDDEFDDEPPEAEGTPVPAARQRVGLGMW